jgi:hypothetical protein
MTFWTRPPYQKPLDHGIKHYKVVYAVLELGQGQPSCFAMGVDHALVHCQVELAHARYNIHAAIRRRHLERCATITHSSDTRIGSPAFSRVTGLLYETGRLLRIEISQGVHLDPKQHKDTHNGNC